MKQILMQTRKIAPAAKRELVRESNPPNELQRITLRLPPKKEVISHLVNTMIIARKVPCQSPIQRVAMGLWQGAVEHAVNVAGQMVHLLWNKTKKEKLAKSNTFDTYSGKTSRSFMMPWLWLRVRTNISGKPSGDSCRDGSSLLTCSAQIWVCCVQYGQGKWQNSSWFWQLPKHWPLHQHWGAHNSKDHGTKHHRHRTSLFFFSCTYERRSSWGLCTNLCCVSSLTQGT